MPPRTPAPTYSLKSREMFWITKPISAIARCSCTAAPGRRDPKERNTSPPRSSSASAARERKRDAPAVVYGGSVTTVSNAPAQLRRQRPAEVVLDARRRERRSGELALEKGDERGIDVHDREARDRRTRAVVAHEQPECERGQVVVAEQEHAAADEGTGLVDREEATELRLDRAVALVELEPGGRPAPDGARELAHERREPGRDDDPPPAAARARGRAADAQAAAGEERAPGRRQLRRPLLRDERALAELAADGGHDRHRQLGRTADPARRDGLEPGERGQNGTDAPLALGEPDGGRHLADDAALLSQATGGCSGRSPARRRGARGSCSARCRRRCRRT